ncbi:hypothetical protein COCOBI_14-4750 [Coccomyxa sp. Obi]|nr:hypothetical protein COCOBI_14-4750 [Coccomyxa sp. Obi]
MQLANNIGRLQLLAQRKSASRQAGLALRKAKKLKGGTPTKRVQVVLPDGQRQEWHLRNAEDLDRALNVNKLGGGALLNKSIDPPRVVVAFEAVEEDQLYHVLPPRHSSPSRTNLTIWLPVDEGARYVKRIFPSVSQAALLNVLATCGLDGVRSADQPEEIAMADIFLLEDDAEYFGVSAETSALRGTIVATFVTVLHQYRCAHVKDVHLTLPSAQVERLERVHSKPEEGNKDALRERLHHIAALENPSGIVKSMCRKKYSWRGQVKVEVDAAVTVRLPNNQPPLAYIAERKRTLALTAFDEVEDKWSAMRAFRDAIPELKDDFGGVQTAQLFVAGDVLATNLTLRKLVEESLQRNIRVFMRSGQEYRETHAGRSLRGMSAS